MAYRQFISLIHKSTRRDYLARVTERDKAEVAELALQWGHDYWDGSRQTGYGGYRYDGRWRAVADAMVEVYGLKPGMRVLDVGAGEGFCCDLTDLWRVSKSPASTSRPTASSAACRA
jgi:protein-L-isoaspartate(D-aspartate) O-methyltransferase